MRARGLWLLAAVTALSVLVTVLATRSERARTGAGSATQVLFPELPAQAEALQRVRVLTAAGEVNLRFEATAWKVQEKYGYPADVAQIRNLLEGLAGLRLLEARTADPARHGALDLTDPQQAGGRGTLVEVYGREARPLAAVILGKPRKAGGSGERQLYLRRPGEDQTWLAAGSADPPRSPVLWLDRRVLDVTAPRVREVRVALEGSAPYTLTRADAQAEFTLAPLPRGRSADAGRLAAASYGLQGLVLQDVLRPQEVRTEWEQASVVTYTTFDQLEVTLRIARVDEVPHARIAAQALEGAADAVVDEAARIERECAPWVYTLAPHTVETFTRPPAELLAAPAADADPERAR